MQSLLTDANRRLLEDRISAWLGHPFSVAFEVAEAEAGSTVADEERERAAAARRELIERFKRDPVVKEFVRVFNGTVDEASVRELTADEKN